MQKFASYKQHSLISESRYSQFTFTEHACSSTDYAKDVKFYGEVFVSLRITLILLDLPLSAVHCYLFNVLAAVHHIWRLVTKLPISEEISRENIEPNHYE